MLRHLNAFSMGFSLLLGLLLDVKLASANILVNGDFETGNATGWTIQNEGFGTPGTITYPTWDVAGIGVDSTCFRAQVGSYWWVPVGVYTGGSLQQVVTLAAGDYTLSADVAVQVPASNLTGGYFELSLAGLSSDSITFSNVTTGQIYRDHLEIAYNSLPAGSYTVVMKIERAAGNDATTPYQLVDNIELVPEPTSLALFGVGAAAILMRRDGRKRKGRTSFSISGTTITSDAVGIRPLRDPDV